jgi:hypothetical protein
MACFVRLMVVKQRTGWGSETLVREVSDSLHLRRFCLLPLTVRVPDESTVRKLVRRLGPEVIAELTRVVIGKAQRERRFAARAVRIDSTVVEADIRYPADGCWPCKGHGRWPARAASWPVGCAARPGWWWIVPGGSAGWCAISRTLARRTGQRTGEVLALNAKAGRALAPGENRLLDQTAAELERLGLRPREVALDGGFVPGPTARPWPHSLPPGRSSRTGRAGLAPHPQAPGPLPHRLRGPHQPPQARLRTQAQPPQGRPGQRIWTGWAILADNLDTLAIHTT